MSTAKPAPGAASPQPKEGFLASFKKFAVALLFALVLLLPRLLRLRHNARLWLFFRLALGLCGAALILLPLRLPAGWLPSLAGLALFLAAVLLPPARRPRLQEEKARELGALVIVNGGEYQPGHAAPAAVQLFAGTESIWALDSSFRPLLVIPLAELRTISVLPGEFQSTLRLEWAAHSAEFLYRGFFAEHLAGVAASTLRGLQPSPLTILRSDQDSPPKSRGRAAGL